eukprot:39557-Chlamydomonas_euryale.AAC.1
MCRSSQKLASPGGSSGAECTCGCLSGSDRLVGAAAAAAAGGRPCGARSDGRGGWGSGSAGGGECEVGLADAVAAAPLAAACAALAGAIRLKNASRSCGMEPDTRVHARVAAACAA